MIDASDTSSHMTLKKKLKQKQNVAGLSALDLSIH